MSEPGLLDAQSDVSSAALRRYRERLKRQRLVYFSIVGVLVVALSVVVAIAWEHGEVANTTLHTFHPAPRPLVLAKASTHQTQAWTTTDRTAIGTPVWRGTVVTFDTHTVRGRDARTGKQTWYYTRSDRTVCTAIQTAGRTIAVYEVGGNCDELTALGSSTGLRHWTRTLDKDGMPLDGQASYQVTDGTVLFSSSTVIYAIDPGDGYDRWEYQRYGCKIGNVVLGDSGVLISQRCSHPDCGTQMFCGRGPQLLLRDSQSGRDDKNDANPDRITWNKLGDTDVPVSADELTTALNTTTRALDSLDPATGKSLGSIALTPAPEDVHAPVAQSADNTELVWVGGVTYAIPLGSTRTEWTASTTGPPTVVASALESITASTQIATPAAGGIRLLDGFTGRTRRAFQVAVPPPGSRVYPMGTGFVVSSGGGTVVYR